MPKMKMLENWSYAERGVNVINYKKGEIYDVDDRCVEICKKTKRGEPAKGGDQKKDKVMESEK